MESFNSGDLSSPSHKVDQSQAEEEPKANTIQSIISTLPRQQGWISPTAALCQYEGFWYPDFFLSGVLALAQDPLLFDPFPSDIILTSCIKTGTTWLKALAFSIATRSHFDHHEVDDHGRLGETSSLLKSVPHDLIPFLEVDIAQKKKTRDPKHPLFATHIPYTSLPDSIKAHGCKIIYICRDPKDTFVSIWHFTNELRSQSGIKECLPLEEALDCFCRGESVYGPYWDHVLGYWKASSEFPNRVLLLKFEDMMTDTLYYVKRLAEFMGYPFSQEEETEGVAERIIDMCGFDSLSNLEVNKTGIHRPQNQFSVRNNVFFRKGKVGDWRNHLTMEMAKKLDKITNEKLGSTGLIWH